MHFFLLMPLAGFRKILQNRNGEKRESKRKGGRKEEIA